MIVLTAALVLASSALPPERYREQMSASSIMFLPMEAVEKVCSKLFPPKSGEVSQGCTVVTKEGDVYIILPDPCKFAEKGEWYARIVCHERAHQAGWPPTHGP